MYLDSSDFFVTLSTEIHSFLYFTTSVLCASPWKGNLWLDPPSLCLLSDFLSLSFLTLDSLLTVNIISVILHPMGKTPCANSGELTQQVHLKACQPCPTVNLKPVWVSVVVKG